MNDMNQSVTEKHNALADAVQVLREQMGTLTQDVLLDLVAALFHSYDGLHTIGWEQCQFFVDNYHEGFSIGEPLINGKAFDDDNESMSQTDLENVDVEISSTLRNIEASALHKLYGDGVVTFHRNGQITIEPVKSGSKLGWVKN
jgi:hypothetical protein